MVKIMSREQTRRKEYEQIQEKPFAQIHGKPSHSDYNRLENKIKKIAVTVQILAYDSWANKYDILAEVIGNTEYLAKTGLNYDKPTKPEDYNPLIRDNSSTVMKARKEAGWETKKESCTVIEGTREATQYYEQFEDTDLGYGEITIKDYLDHLTKEWCKLNMKAIQEMKDRYFRGWDEDEHITAFGQRLSQEQRELRQQNVTITDSDKLQHYLVQMYVSDMFDRRELTDWEKKSTDDRTYTNALKHFQGIATYIKLLKENRGGTSKKVCYKSAAAVEDAKEKVGRKIRHYIEGLVSQKEQDKETMAQMTVQMEQINVIQGNVEGATSSQK